MSDTEKSFPFDSVELTDGSYDRPYYSEDFADYFAQFLSNGVYPNPSNNLLVESLNNNMVLTVNAGSAFIKGRGYINKEPLYVTVSNSDIAYNRIDFIVLQLNLVEREIKILYKEGVPSSSPVKPSLTRNDDIYELKLAEILVKSGVQNITTADITDTRLDSSVCGIVTAVIDNVDTTALFQQYESYLNTKISQWNETQLAQSSEFKEQMTEQKTEFENWFNGAKLDIANLQKFDFDNLIYMAGYVYSAVKEETGWLEKITKADDESIFAQRISTKDTVTGAWTVTTICESLGINTVIVYSKENGWKGVINNA